MERHDLIAPCGLDCSKCDIYRAKDEPETMSRILKWFGEERGLKLEPEQVKCDGCLGDRSSHWSADCDILGCSVDKRGLTSCSCCPKMPCEKIETFAKHGKKYSEAVDRLKSMKDHQS